MLNVVINSLDLSPGSESKCIKNPGSETFYKTVKIINISRTFLLRVEF